MQVLGIAVQPNGGRPFARVIVLDGTWDSPVLTDAFTLTSSHTDLGTMLHDLAVGLTSRLAEFSPDRVVVRRADFHKSSSKQDGPKIRLMAEGALAAAARVSVEEVSIETGNHLGTHCPAGTKEALLARAAAEFAGEDEDAVAAALAGLSM